MLNLLYLWRIWCLDLIGYNLHRQLKSSLEKNLSLYSPIGAWLVIALVALTYRKLEWPKNLSHELPLIYNGSIGLLSASTRSRKCFSNLARVLNIRHTLFKNKQNFLFFWSIIYYTVLNYSLWQTIYNK